MKERLRKLLNNSYAPLSGYCVACIIEDDKGNIYEGVNIETTSPAAGICAERNALYSMLTKGKKDIKAIYIMNKTDKECYPCFICRQALNDFCSKETIIKTYNYDGTIEKEVSIADLCPYPFDKEDLKEEI